METLRLKARPPVEDEIENWDDDDFLIEGDDLPFQSQSNSANAPSNRRDSQSSFRSDFESITGEEEKQVHLPGDDEKSTLDAIAAAAKAGIPIPKNVPPSALMGGTIKRLGGRKIRKIIQEDWVDDLEFPDNCQSLQFKHRESSQFPETLRQVSNSGKPSPSKTPRESLSAIPVQEDRRETNASSISNSYIDLERFRDNEDDDDFFGDGGDTIKVSKRRQTPKLMTLITSPPTPAKPADGDDDFEKDFELPSDGKLRLSAKRDVPKTPTFNTILDDLDWTEGSLGTRFGGTRRDIMSTRASSVCALSPSISSSMTAESEDEIFDGLIIPNGPLDLGERLRRRRQSRSPVRCLLPSPIKEEKDKEDFFSGLDFGDGEVFDSRKLTLHRNIQVKETRPNSPSRVKASVALKFTNKPVTASRLPRPMGPAANHERTHTQSSLEPVSESGGPITHSHIRRSLSRLGHSAQSSITSVNSMGSMKSIASPPTPSSVQTITPTPATPRRRELGPKASVATLRSAAEPTTTSAQLLRQKRSLPAMRAIPSPGRSGTANRNYERPPSRSEFAARAPQSGMRPKTPVERTLRASESAASQSRKAPVPFLPAGASMSQSHNINAKSSRTLRRHDSEASIDFRPNSRAVSRSTIRSPSPRRYRPTEKATPDGSWSKLSMPRRLKNFGDGHELDAFDDLPTSTQAEAKFLKQPVSGGAKMHMRSKTFQNILPDRTTSTPSPFAPYTPRVDSVPSFARDTTASRIARETILAQRNPSGPLAPLTAQRVAQLSARSNLASQPPTVRAKKLRRSPQAKPHLIANLNPPREAKDSKPIQGMWYNPDTFRWEGNDNALRAFDPPASSPSTASVPQYLIRERENATPRPALITNIGATKGVQVVGGMVFDPQAMCWLKIGPQSSHADSNDPMDGFDALDDEDDVFKDIPDLEERTMASSDGGNGRSNDIKDDWLVGEEFDVGPEFVRRQREEEDRWRKKCNSWISNQADRGENWKWAIRDIVNQSLAD
ncbi:putative cytokinesis inhibitor byr4 [Podospora australis]|uniref:Cytokinesis inhibitor byr4 n=1 Tax=Podospora australis TaxID=1536484 RepID=A0AAN7ALA2_9PEZI|nr:putative cytokinesis inhibitor byr4 [Podospora australis]